MSSISVSGHLVTQQMVALFQIVHGPAACNSLILHCRVNLHQWHFLVVLFQIVHEPAASYSLILHC